MALQASFVVNALGGLAFLIVGGLLLALRPARRGAIGFALFAVAAGLQYIFANVGSMLVDVPLVGMLRLPFLLVAPLALVWGAARFHGHGARWATLPFLATGAAAALLLLFAPGVIVAPNGFYRPLGDFLALMPFFAGMAVAAGLLVAHHRRETSADLRLELVLLLSALVPLLAYSSGYFGLSYAVGLREFALAPTVGYLVTFALCAAVVIACCVLLWRAPERSAKWLAGISLVLLPAGILHALLDRSWAQFGGMLRIAAALLLGYALLRYRIFDIDVRLKTSLARTLAGGLAVGAFFLASEVAETVVADRTGSTLLGLAAAGAFLVLETRLMHAGKRIAQRALPGVDPSERYLAQRKLVVYRAAVESAGRDGVMTERERTLLGTLARELKLTHEEKGSIDRDFAAAVAA